MSHSDGEIHPKTKVLHTFSMVLESLNAFVSHWSLKSLHFSFLCLKSPLKREWKHLQATCINSCCNNIIQPLLSYRPPHIPSLLLTTPHSVSSFTSILCKSCFRVEFAFNFICQLLSEPFLLWVSTATLTANTRCNFTSLCVFWLRGHPLSTQYK